MADPTVKLQFAGNSADAEKAIAQLERKYDALEQKLKRTRATTKQTASDGVSDFGKLGNSILGAASKLAPMIAGVAGISSVLSKVAEANNKFATNMDEFGKRFAETDVKAAVQMDVDPAELKRRMDVAVKQLKRTPVTGDVNLVADMQTQLASSGVRADDIQSGAAVGAMLDMQAATNAIGKEMGDPREVVKSISQLLKGAGKANPTAGDIRDLGGAITSLFKESDVTFSDFKQLAPKVASLEQFGIDEKEAAAIFSANVDVMGAERGATGLATFVTRTATAGNTKERSEAFKKLGLKPDDVAMAKGGKGFLETIKLINSKLKEKSQEEQNSILEHIYGLEGGPAAAFMLSDEGIATIEKRRSQALDPTAFERGVTRFQGSRFAQQNLREIEKQDATRTVFANTTMTWGEADAALGSGMAQERARASKMQPGLGRAARQSSLSFQEGMASMFGYGMKAMGIQPSDIGLGPGPNLIQGAAGGQGAMNNKEAVEELKKINSNLEKNRPQPNLNGNRE